MVEFNVGHNLVVLFFFQILFLKSLGTKFENLNKKKKTASSAIIELSCYMLIIEI